MTIHPPSTYEHHAVLEDLKRHLIEITHANEGPDAPIKMALIIQFVDFCDENRPISLQDTARWLRIKKGEYRTNSSTSQRRVRRGSRLLQNLLCPTSPNEDSVVPRSSSPTRPSKGSAWVPIPIGNLVRHLYVKVKCAYDMLFKDLDLTRRALDVCRGPLTLIALPSPP